MSGAFDFRGPTQVRFGSGRRRELPRLLAGRRWGVLSTPGILARTGLLEELGPDRAAGLVLVSLGAVRPNPRCGQVQAALEVACAADVDGILAIGGGSVMDAAKLLRVAYRHGVTVSDALLDLASVVRATPRSEPYLLVVPTTAGTGAEVSQGAIITDDHDGRKLAARGPSLIPDEAVIDPELTVSLPAWRTAETGFDVIAHAVETYLSRAATPVTDILARAALEVVPAALVRAVANGQDLESRTTLALHSWLMGYNLAHASTCLPHRMQYAIGALTDTSHQIGLAALYPAWTRAVAPFAEERMALVAERIRTSLGSIGVVPVPDSEPGDVFGDLLQRIGLRVTLADIGIRASQVEDLAAAVEGRIDLDPMQPSREDIRRIFTAAAER